MFRFVLPANDLTLSEKAEAIGEQLNKFLLSEPLQNLFKLLDVDRNTIYQAYNGRIRDNGRVVEVQELPKHDALEEKKHELYPYFKELGFFDINKPLEQAHSHIVVLGGSLKACYDRTFCAKMYTDTCTKHVDGLACYRPINPIERIIPHNSNIDTEFGAVADSFIYYFSLTPESASNEFCGDRNLNSVSCIRKYNETTNGIQYRVFAAPSSQPELRRADTGDTLRFYLRSVGPFDDSAHLLFITNNRYCNRQFLQLAHTMITEKCPSGFDIIGCTDENTITADNYDPYKYVQDLIGILDWSGRFLG